MSGVPRTRPSPSTVVLPARATRRLRCFGLVPPGEEVMKGRIRGYLPVTGGTPDTTA